MLKKEKILIIGAGFSALSASCYLSKAGFEVLVLEKNKEVGGRARQLCHEGFTFDLGPTFYWMPDVFESFFNDFGFTTSKFYSLTKLNPAYQVYFGNGSKVTIGDQLEAIITTFESIEAGSGNKLRKFIIKASENYHLAIKDLVYKPGIHVREIVTLQTMKKLTLFIDNIRNTIRKHFKHPWLCQILEFPVLFLGSTASRTPAFYNFMNYADFGLGTWYPEGGMYGVVEGIIKLAKSLNVKFITNSEVTSIQTEGNSVTGIKTVDKNYTCDILLSGADYAHTESLLPKKYRQYSSTYWSNKKFAPSAFLYYVGFDKTINQVAHHTLFFDTDFEKHADCIYKTKELPTDPLFYASFPSKTDKKVAPAGEEASIFLIPIAPDSTDNQTIRDLYFEKIIARLEKQTKQHLKSHIKFMKSYGVLDFKKDYHAYKGNAYGLANTLLQTHALRPKMKSKKMENLFFTGQLTVPGPGVPPSIISGKIVSNLIQKKYENTF